MTNIPGSNTTLSQHPIPMALLSQLSRVVSNQIGLCFPETRWNDLSRGICAATKELGFKDVEAACNGLVSSPLTHDQITILARYLTIGETYFFREKKTFDIFERHILPDLLKSREKKETKQLRIWSAGCATGEEPYSIAILLNKMNPDLMDWNITILATDINPHSLQKAAKGIYTGWSFRDTPSNFKELYFKKIKDGCYEIAHQIKKLVTFSYLNLAKDHYPLFLNNTNAIDIIFCRNVLMYFVPEQAKKIAESFYHCLLDHGWLITSPAEVSSLLDSQFTRVSFENAILYKKDSHRKDLGYVVVGNGLDPSIQILKPSMELEAGENEDAGRLLKLRNEQSVLPIDDKEVAAKASLSNVDAVFNHQWAEAKQTDLSADKAGLKAAIHLAKTYANQGRLIEASKWSKRAIDMDRLNPGCLFLHAIILQENGETEQAIKALKQAIYLDQELALAHFMLGNLTWQQGKLKDSNKHFKNTISLLANYKPEEVLPYSEGMTAARLIEITESMLNSL